MEATVQHNYALPKAEKLCSEKAIESLFANGTSFVKFPIRVVFSAPQEMGPDGVRCQILTSVPKKRFKRAVKRNRIKRLMREAYRLNKHILLDALADRHVNMAFVYVDNNLPTFVQMQKSMVAALKRVADTVRVNNDVAAQ